MERAVLEKAVAGTAAISGVHDKASLFEAVDGVCKQLGFDVFLLSCHKRNRQEMVMDSTFTSISQGFLADYERLDWFDSDMNIGRVMDVAEGFFWDSSTDRDPDGRKQSFIDYLYANEMCTGLMVPLTRRPGTASAFSLIANTGQRFGSGVIEAARIVGNAALLKAEMLGLSDAVSSDAARATTLLSDMQKEVLSWIAEGKSNTDIATIMDINERAVRYHVSEILRKLGVATRMQAASYRVSAEYERNH